MIGVTEIALSLALGAGAVAGKKLISELVKDAYEDIKSKISERYPGVSVEELEKKPDSEMRRGVVAEDLDIAGAGADSDLALRASKLMEAVVKEAPETAKVVGVELEHVKGAALRLKDIVSAGTGVTVKESTFTDDIEIENVRAGVDPAVPNQDTSKKN